MRASTSTRFSMRPKPIEQSSSPQTSAWREHVRAQTCPPWKRPSDRASTSDIAARPSPKAPACSALRGSKSPTRESSA